jgi:protein-S-isoprenylcysteine O-methyltransferase Ste14
MNDAIFRGSLALVSGLLTVIRLFYGWRAHQRGGKVIARRASWGRTAVLYLLGGAAAHASIMYIVAPNRLRWAALPLPAWARWLGISLGGVTVLLFGWVHHTLGANWSMPAEIKERQTLITRGPYRWVRHPMYTTIFVWAVAFLLMSANWLVGGLWFGLSLVAAALTPIEEAALIERFGDAYRVYMRHTGRFLPRLWRRNASLGSS